MSTEKTHVSKIIAEHYKVAVKQIATNNEFLSTKYQIVLAEKLDCVKAFNIFFESLRITETEMQMEVIDLAFSLSKKNEDLVTHVQYQDWIQTRNKWMVAVDAIKGVLKLNKDFRESADINELIDWMSGPINSTKNDKSKPKSSYKKTIFELVNLTSEKTEGKRTKKLYVAIEILITNIFTKGVLKKNSIGGLKAAYDGYVKIIGSRS